jgi:hypothetical protein
VGTCATTLTWTAPFHGSCATAGGRHVECNRDEGLVALAWARERRYWPAHVYDDAAPVYMRGVTSA